MIEDIELGKRYTNRDDAEFIFKAEKFVTMHLTGQLDSKLDHIPAILYSNDVGHLCVMSVETFKSQFRLVTKGKRK